MGSTNKNFSTRHYASVIWASNRKGLKTKFLLPHAAQQAQRKVACRVYLPPCRFDLPLEQHTLQLSTKFLKVCTITIFINLSLLGSSQSTFIVERLSDIGDSCVCPYLNNCRLPSFAFSDNLFVVSF